MAWITATLDAADERDRRSPTPAAASCGGSTAPSTTAPSATCSASTSTSAGAVGMPDDTVGEAFDNLAAALNVSDALMEKYFAAADLILEQLYAPPARRAEAEARRTAAAASPTSSVKPADQPARRPRGGRTLARRAYRRPVEARKSTPARRCSTSRPTTGRSTTTRCGRCSRRCSCRRTSCCGSSATGRKPDDAVPRQRPRTRRAASYFLWSSMPDDGAVRSSPTRANCASPAVFEKQVRRMLADPKAQALTDKFAAQWLQLKKLPDARPSTEFFPTFTAAAAPGDARRGGDVLRQPAHRGPQRPRPARRRLHLRERRPRQALRHRRA